MNAMEDWERTAPHVDVATWEGDVKSPVYRFPNDETGHGRAVEYRNAFNESLRVAMGLTKENLETENPDHINRPGEYEMALRVEQYRDHMAALSYAHPPRLVGNGDPMPTNYPHDF